MAVSCAALLGGCGEASPKDPTPDGGEPAVVYYRDAKPILDDKCVSCHQAGGIAPFALATYDEVVAHKEAIKSAVEGGRMPPWPPDDDCREYEHARSLSDDQLATLVEFVELGAHEGDPNEEGAPLSAGQGGLSRVDLTLPMAEPYTMKVEPDEYRCFVLDWPHDDVRFVTGFRARPGNASVVHHVIAHVVEPSLVADVEALDADDSGPGYECFGGSGVAGSDWVAAWVPGSLGNDFPAGTGIRIEPGSKIVLQLHYNSLTAGPGEDLTEMDLKIDASVEKEARIQPFANPLWVVGDNMELPPASDGVSHSFSSGALNANTSLRVYAAGLHMHQLGRSAKLAITRGGAEECLLDIPAWNFHWQGNYGFQESTVLAPGDQLSVSCTWDNPTMSTVTWGEGTSDEMCLGVVYVTEE